jgi:hypothetical protein
LAGRGRLTSDFGRHRSVRATVALNFGLLS